MREWFGYWRHALNRAWDDVKGTVWGLSLVVGLVAAALTTAIENPTVSVILKATGVFLVSTLLAGIAGTLLVAVTVLPPRLSAEGYRVGKDRQALAVRVLSGVVGPREVTLFVHATNKADRSLSLRFFVEVPSTQEQWGPTEEPYAIEPVVGYVGGDFKNISDHEMKIHLPQNPFLRPHDKAEGWVTFAATPDLFNPGTEPPINTEGNLYDLVLRIVDFADMDGPPMRIPFSDLVG